MTPKWYTTLRHPKMYPHIKFGIPTSKNIGDMDRTRKRDGRTVQLLYASQSSFGGIKTGFGKYVHIRGFVNEPTILHISQNVGTYHIHVKSFLTCACQARQLSSGVQSQTFVLSFN